MSNSKLNPGGSVAGRPSRISAVTGNQKNDSIKRLKMSPLEEIEVSLDRLEMALALRLGKGDLKLGIRRAIVFAGMRQL
jgi:hypothetical protein